MERPKITDKVLFWEEQDKINQALIPRVLEMHEHIKSANLLAQQNSSKYLSVSSTVKELRTNTDNFAKKANSTFLELEKKLELGLKENSNFLQSSKAELEEIKEKIISQQSNFFSLENQFKEFNSDKVKRANTISFIAIGISIISLIISFF